MKCDILFLQYHLRTEHGFTCTLHFRSILYTFLQHHYHEDHEVCAACAICEDVTVVRWCCEPLKRPRAQPRQSPRAQPSQNPRVQPRHLPPMTSQNVLGHYHFSPMTSPFGPQCFHGGKLHGCTTKIGQN